MNILFINEKEWLPHILKIAFWVNKKSVNLQGMCSAEIVLSLIQVMRICFETVFPYVYSYFIMPNNIGGILYDNYGE